MMEWLLSLVGVAAAVIGINSPQNIKTIDTCTIINKPGVYSISKDIVNIEDKPCIVIQNTKNVTLGCGNHTITSKRENHALLVKNVTNFDIGYCTFDSSEPYVIDGHTQHTVHVENSKNGRIHQNNIKGSFADIRISSGIEISNNNIYVNLQNYRSTNNIFSNNNFETSLFSELLSLYEGKNNVIRNNTFDSKSDGVFENRIGADDAITLKNEESVVITNNLIKNIYECGIESLGQMNNSIISNNEFDNMGLCAIGGWYDSSLSKNIFRNNNAKNTPAIFYYYRARGMLPSEKKVYFTNNQFSNNTLSQRKMNTPAPAVFIQFVPLNNVLFGERPIKMSDYVLTNNVFNNNNFGIDQPLSIQPELAVKDGGNNTCMSDNTPTFPLKCSLR